MTASDETVAPELERLVDAFFDAVSFEPGSQPAYERIHDLFIDAGLLIRNVGAAAVPEICGIRQFIDSRQALVDSGELTRFHEAALAGTTEIFGNVAHRSSGYVKSGTSKGVPFGANGWISAQFVRTPHGWRMSSMAWDDEREGLRLPAQYR